MGVANNSSLGEFHLDFSYHVASSLSFSVWECFYFSSIYLSSLQALGALSCILGQVVFMMNKKYGVIHGSLVLEIYG